MSKLISRRFDSVDAMLDYAKRPVPKGANSSAVQSWTTRMVDARYEYDWYGMTSTETRCPVVYASDMLRTGWSEVSALHDGSGRPMGWVMLAVMRQAISTRTKAGNNLDSCRPVIG